MRKTEMKNKFKFPVNETTVSRVESLIDEIDIKHDLGEEKYGKISLAVIEAVENGIKHGNKLDPESYLDLSYRISDREVGFVIKDEGEGFDHKKINDPTSIKMKVQEKGRGIYIMKILADEINFNNCGNEVELKFKL